MSAQYPSAQRSSRAALWAGYALIGVVLIALPFAVDAALGRSWVRIMDVALLFTMLALGLNIVVGYAGLLDLGYVAFFAVGAYCYALLGSPQLGIHLGAGIVADSDPAAEDAECRNKAAAVLRAVAAAQTLRHIAG